MNITRDCKKGILTFEEIMERPWYRGILDVVEIFDQGDGIRPIFFRYFLMENPRIDKFFYGTIYTFLKKFESEHKDDLNYKLFLSNDPRGCIKSKSSLSNFLNKLVNDYELLIKEEDKQYQINRYKLSSYGKKMKIRHGFNRILYRFDNSELEEIYTYANKKYSDKLNIEFKKMGLLSES